MQTKFKKIKISWLLKAAYLIFLIFTVLYVRAVLKENSFRVVEREPEKKIEKVTQVDATLIVSIAGKDTTYTSELSSDNTINDLMSGLRKEGKLTYELDEYLYGTEILSVSGQEADPGKRWSVLLDDVDLTNNLKNEFLKDKATYTIRMTDR